MSVSLTTTEARCSCGKGRRLLNPKTGKLWAHCLPCRTRRKTYPSQRAHMERKRDERGGGNGW